MTRRRALRCGRLGRSARSGDSFTDSEPGAMAERRPERVAHLVQAELATVFLREANDPRLRDLTVTAVRMSADLRVARVYVRTLGDTADARAAALRALARATTFLRGRVGRALGLRVTPELRFEYDTQPDTARRVDDLRSEEHTSELQSRLHLVCRLLL